MEGFSVDRRKVYQVGSDLALFSADPFGRPFFSLPGWWSQEDLAVRLKALFPEGLSQHGWQYMVFRNDFIVGPNGQAYVIHEWQVELTFEAIRKSDFPHRPSRMQCYFAWETLEAARAFKAADQHIYRLSSSNGFRADQKWLTLGVQNVSSVFNAHQYWSGNASGDPRWEILLKAPVAVSELME